MNKPRICFIDDEAGSCKWFKKNMDRLGFDVVTFQTLEEAEYSIFSTDEGNAFDLIICDYFFENSKDGGKWHRFAAKVIQY